MPQCAEFLPRRRQPLRTVRQGQVLHRVARGEHRQADPRLAANDLEIEIVATLDARPRDVALAQRAIERAGYEAWYPPPRWVSALPPPPTEVTR